MIFSGLANLACMKGKDFKILNFHLTLWKEVFATEIRLTNQYYYMYFYLFTICTILLRTCLFSFSNIVWYTVLWQCTVNHENINLRYHVVFYNSHCSNLLQDYTESKGWHKIHMTACRFYANRTFLHVKNLPLLPPWVHYLYQQIDSGMEKPAQSSCLHDIKK